jgi:hypothetical protein
MVISKKARKKVLTITEFARMGGLARAASMTPKQRSEAARYAMSVRWRKHRKKIRNRKEKI